MILKKRRIRVLGMAWFFAGFLAVDASAQPIGLMPSQVGQKPQPNVLCSPVGRFVFGQVSDSKKDQFMLDTMTGRLWRISETGEVGIFLTPVLYRTKDGKYEPLPDAVPGGVPSEGAKR